MYYYTQLPPLTADKKTVPVMVRNTNIAYILKHLEFKKLNIITSLPQGHQQADRPREKPIHMRKAGT
jgi:hypothetical protein